MLRDFATPGKASFILGGQWGSEGKGAAAAWLAARQQTEGRTFDIVTTNAGSQSGHTSVHQGETRIAFHLPTVPLIDKHPIIYLNAGSIIDVPVLLSELDYVDSYRVFIHPNAAIITDDCKAAEGRDDSPQTRISSTRKGVGEALARKVLRSGLTARNCPELKQFIRPIDLNHQLDEGKAVLVEIPQGLGLSLNSQFYPYCTSRDCTIAQAMNDAGIHPAFMGHTMLVLRTFPIRVGSLPGHTSGDAYQNQRELDWKTLGVEAELTTVTKRVRRVFSWSYRQLLDAMRATRPEVIFLTHCDYLKSEDEATGLINQIKTAVAVANLRTPIIVTSNGPTTDDAKIWNGF